MPDLITITGKLRDQLDDTDDISISLILSRAEWAMLLHILDVTVAIMKDMRKK